MLTKRSGKLVDWSESYSSGSLGRYESLYRVQTAFAFLQILISLAILTATILNRKRGLHGGVVFFKSLMISLVLYIIANLLSAIIYCIYLTDTTVKMAIELAFLLDEFAWLFAFCTIIFLFYRIISRFRKRSTGRSPKSLNILHGVFLGLLAAVCGAEWSLYVGYMVRTNGVNYTWRIAWHWMQCARQIVFWIASLEVVIWALIVTVRTSRIDRQARASAISFALSSIGFFAMNLMYAIITIQWDIIAYQGYYSSFSTPQWLRYFQIIFPVLCLVVTFFGLMLCCSRLAGLHDFDAVSTEIPSLHPMTTYQHPYTIPLEVESRQRIIEADQSREFWEAGSRPVHEADADYRIRQQKP